MEKLSVVVITFNEQNNIGKCIDSVAGLADEVIVVDSFSQDHTAQVVREKGARLFQQTFSGYGAQKNTGARHASFNHILFLDADECPDEKLCKSIRAEKEMGFPWEGYSMNRLNNYCGKWIRHGSWYPDKKLRLIDRQKGQWNDLLVHETIEMQPASRIRHLSGNLLHDAYQRIEDQISKNNHYSALSAQLLFSRGSRTGLFKILANPFWAFFSGYVLRLGFLDGYYGFVVAVNIAHLSFLKHVKLLQLQKKALREN
jgi:glycosyltransferase involved in cell wall biosynthesis